MWPMAASVFIKARLSSELKEWVRALADRQHLSESAWLKRLVIREVQAADGDCSTVPAFRSLDRRERGRHRPKEAAGRSSRRVYVRLRNDDRLLLQARAEARGMRPATYVSVLTRCHLRQLAPLPKDELLALKRSVGELAAIGRNLNQIARVANEGGRLPGSPREELRAMLKVCEALRDHTRDLLKVNLTSWQSGYGEDL